jgi:hypothetical protein
MCNKKNLQIVSFNFLLYNCRRVIGLFKIASRMFSRRQLCGPILTLLDNLFAQQNLEDSTHNDSLSYKSNESSATPADDMIYEIAGQVFIT